MKKFAILFLFIFVFGIFGADLSMAVPKPPRTPAEINTEINRVQNYVDTLQNKLQNTRDPARRQDLKRMIDVYNKRLKALQKELAEVTPPPGFMRTKPATNVASKTPPPLPPPPPPAPMVQEPSRTIGVSAGLFAGIPGVVAEMRLREPFDLKSTSVKLGLGYAKGNDSNSDERSHGAFLLTGIYHLTPPGTPGINPYLGAGLNYDFWSAPTAGGQARSGTVGADIFLGLEGSAGAGKLFAELGYDILRTDYSPDYRGFGLQVGYRHPW